MQSLRIEKCLPLYGPDISEEETPFHVGLGRWVRFDKRDFVGREALLRVQESGLDRRWVGLTLESEAPAAAGAGVYGIADVATFRDVVETGAEAGEQEDELMPGEQQVGRVTSSAMGHTVGRMLAMAYVDTAHSWPGNNLVVELGGRPIPAKVAQTPFFDPEFARVRARSHEDDRLSELVPEPARLTNARVPASQSPNGNTRR
jgi:aminomethyltransferase